MMNIVTLTHIICSKILANITAKLLNITVDLQLCNVTALVSVTVARYFTIKYDDVLDLMW